MLDRFDPNNNMDFRFCNMIRLEACRAKVRCGFAVTICGKIKLKAQERIRRIATRFKWRAKDLGS